jgi:serine/threonine-protein kinase ULK4
MEEGKYYLTFSKANLLSSLVHLLDHATPVTKGKAALALMLVIRFNISLLSNVSEESLRFYSILDKALRE